MKILVVGQFFYPDNFRINDIVKNLVELGNDVTMVTGLPDYETGYIPNEYRFFRKRKEKYHGASVIRLPIIQRRSGALFRALNYVSFVFSGSIYLLLSREKYDKVFMFQTSPVTMAIPGLLYGKKNKVKTILYCLDIWPECVQAMNIREGSKIFDLIHLISRYTYHAADQVLVSSKSFIEYLHIFNQVPLEKLQYFPQYTDEENEYVQHTSSADKSLKFLFAGNIGQVQDVETIIEAVKVIPGSEDFVVDIVGSGTNMDKVKSMVASYGLDSKIRFHGRKLQSEMDTYYDEADVCLLTLKSTNRIGLTIPGKLQTYMAKGKAVAAAINGDSVEIINHAEAGMVVASGDAEGLSRIMLRYIREKSLVKTHGMNAYRYYKNNFAKDRFFGKLVTVLEDL